MVELDEAPDEVFWEEYEHRIECLGDRILEELKEHESYDRDGHLNGRKWCDEHSVPETVFADAVRQHPNEIEWGVTPMYPWLVPKTRFDP